MMSLIRCIPAALSAIVPVAACQPGSSGAPQPEWMAAEGVFLKDYVQLTSRDMFVKAGEAYFSPDSRWIVFQAVPIPAEDEQPDPFYSMYIAKLVRDGASGKVTGIEKPVKVSPDGSANTCGWFHPTEPGRVLLGSTLVRPSDEQPAGFQVGGRKYVWMFPTEMDVCTRFSMDLWKDMVSASGGAITSIDAPPDLEKARPLFAQSNYDAECSYSTDGRLVLYAHVRDELSFKRADADIWVYDTKSKQHHPLIDAEGYDGGPFFSPDGKKICYRSDRVGNDLLQLFVAELELDDDGVPIGILREVQVTDNAHVNWAPFWHPTGSFLVYGTSEVGHQNYEVFAVEVDLDKPPVALTRRRITYAPGADVLPVFNADGTLMMWTGQRGQMSPGDSRPSSQLWLATWRGKDITKP